MPDTTSASTEESSPTIPVVTFPNLPMDANATNSDDQQLTAGVLPSSSDSPHATSDQSPPQLLVPIPAPSMNKSQSSFAFSSPLPGESELYSLDELPPEIATADISIAPDGSFVETSSGLAARELKRRYDQHLGVGKDVRSPYAITAFVNQHGKQMYRVGNRDLSAPAASAVEVADRVTQAVPATQKSHSGRRSRMSVHHLLAQGKSKNLGVPPPVRPLVEQTACGTGHASAAVGTSPRRLRKTRSIPDMFGMAAVSPAPSSNTGGRQNQTLIAGRIHSHSVTGADMPRLPPAIIDMPKPLSADTFADVMHWQHGTSVPPSPYTSSSVLESSGEGSIDPYDEGFSAPIISHPFGTGVTFDSPSKPSPHEFLPMPHALREMQSFDSILTARAGDTPHRERTPILIVDSGVYGGGPVSPDDMQALPVSALTKADEHSDPEYMPLPETSMHSQYSTEVFDVLQTYRGLPQLDRLFPNSREPTIKLSLRADDGAAPRDDPRFVIWGEVHKDDGDDQSISHDSRTGLSSPVLSASRRLKGKSVAVPELRISSWDHTQRILLAATIERWIAQLTSEFNYDELLNFFLTYRTYISAVDLCHLLICRFHWALTSHASKHDEDIRRIVRVRAFVAMRYWLLTFFAVDFLPNRELRLLLADWLNALIRDPILTKHQGALSIVRRLIKVVKDCKEAHTRKRRGSISKSQSISHGAKSPRNHLLGEKFAEAVSKDEDSDVDLDFIPDDTSDSGPTLVFQGDSANPYTFGGQMPAPRPPAVSSASAVILQQPLQVNILQSRKSSSTSIIDGQNPAALPESNSILSRAFVKTIGRLGRWKRVLNSRSTMQTALAVPANVSAFELELNATGDLLTIRGGVEQYLKMIEPQSPATPVGASKDDSSSGVEARPVSTDSTLAESADSQLRDAKTFASSHLRSVTEEESAGDSGKAASVKEHPRRVSIASVERSSLWSRSTDSFGSILSSRSKVNPFVAQVQERPPWQFDVVSIDELDLSDTSSDHHGEDIRAFASLRKVARKLPLRRDFEFVRRSIGSVVSSMGFRSHDSVASEGSGMSSTSAGGLGTNIHQWHLNALVDSLTDDEDEVGDVEDALRRLEGQINPQKRKEKAAKVNGWVKTIQDRMAAGDYGDIRPRFFNDEGTDEEEEDFNIDQHETGSAYWNGHLENDSMTGLQEPTSTSHMDLIATLTSISGLVATPAPDSNVQTSISETTSSPRDAAEGAPETLQCQIPFNPNVSDSTSPLRSSEVKPAVEDVVPLEILQSRVPSRPSTSHGRSPSRHTKSPNATRVRSPSSKASMRKVYKSWILNFRAEVLAQHFATIDRELFLGIKPEELILDDWKSCQEVNVLDWVQYLKDRARWKAESRCAQKTSALGTLRARFNLIANFTASEIVMTHPSDRALVVGKFVRMAFKSYALSNFHTLVAILAGLRSEWAMRAMVRQWNRVGMWETQMMQKLTLFTSPAGYFRAMHEAVASMVDAKPLDFSSHASSMMGSGTADGHVSKGKATPNNKTPSACIPFIGVYLSQLYHYSKLPDLIDPTAPHEVVELDSQSSNFDAPAHPDVFDSLTPLPPSMQLEPLINVHKQRLIAGVIKNLVAGQHLASRIQYPIDKKLFQKCLRLRGLDDDTLQQALGLHSERDALY